MLEITPGTGKVNVDAVPPIAEHQASITKLQTFPNPFSHIATISFTLEQDEIVTIVIYDSEGRRVEEVQNFYNRGTHRIKWDAGDIDGGTFASGVYFISVEADGFSTGSKIMRMK